MRWATCANCLPTTEPSSTDLRRSSWKRRYWIVTKSIPLSVKVAGPSPAPSTSFLFNNRRTWIMGVLNATPDSFYAGSHNLPAEAPDIIDIGGESTRPGAEEISEAVELERVLPVIDEVRSRWSTVPISIDTQKAQV